ncbi:MAG TPA: HIT domain-containing protein [Nitrososphaerales archaeon]|nr:HIT domain-containing protein [Nitrososphaerales archaeon]
MSSPARRKIVNSSSVAPENCVFCKIVAREASSHVVFEDEDYIAFLDRFPFSKGHTLVCPRKHGETIWDMNETEIGGLFRTAAKVSKALVEATDADGFRFVQNNGEAANQVVAHVHVHVIPVKMEDRGRFMDRKTFSEEEMEALARRVREIVS